MTSRAAGSRARAIHKRGEMQGRASWKLRNIDEKIPIFVLRSKDSNRFEFFSSLAYSSINHDRCFSIILTLVYIIFEKKKFKIESNEFKYLNVNLSS